MQRPAGSLPRSSLAGRSPSRLLEAFAPGLGQVAHGQRAVEDPLLEFEAQHDVHRIGELVGIHADRRRAAREPGPVQVVDLPFRAVDAEALLEQRAQVVKERPAAADRSSRAAATGSPPAPCHVAADRLVAPRLGQAEVVERLPGLVQHAHQAREGFLRDEAAW